MLNLNQIAKIDIIIMNFQLSTIVDLVESIASSICRVLQRFLVILIFFLFALFSFIYLENLFKITTIIHQDHDNIGFKLTYLIIGVLFLYNLVFNYVMANMIGPGFSSDISTDLLNRYNVNKKCRKCNQRKPVRAHHCSVCNKCVLQMDHHCPWMGTCVGHYNRRYFIKFLTYLTMSVLLVAHLYITLHLPKTDVFIFVVTISIVIGLFTIYHWIIVLWGRTTLEFCEILDGYKPSKSKKTNFEIVFGTNNLFLALLPYHFPLKYEGCEWNEPEIPQITTNIESDESSFVNSQVH